MSTHGSLSQNTTPIWTRSRPGKGERITLRRRRKGWTWKMRTVATEVIHGALAWIWIWRWRLKEKTDGILAANPYQTCGKHLKDVPAVCYGVPTTFSITSMSIFIRLPFASLQLTPLLRRQKRILFLTCWCRHIPPSPTRPLINDLVDGQTPALPLPITASFSPSSLEQSLPQPPSISGRRHSHRKARHPPPLRHKPTITSNIHSSSHKGDDTSSTIPIRGLSRPTPNPNTQPSAHAHSPATPNKLATSAPGPSGFSFTALGAGQGQGQQSPMARMRIGGFKPRQTPARMVINARAAETTSGSQSSSRPRAQDKDNEGAEGEKRGRSESTTPGPSSVSGGGGASALTAGMRAAGNAAGSAESETGEKKRVKV